MGLATRYIIDLQENLRMIMRFPADREMLHQYRVQVKKMKALWMIHPICNTIAFKTSFPVIDKLYHNAAGIRDRQMVLSCLETIPDFEKFPDLKKQLKAGIKKRLLQFRENIATRRTRHRLSEEIRHYREYFKIASSFLIRQNRKAFREEVFEILARVSGNDPKNLHKARRYCKQLIFQCDAFHVANPVPEQLASRSDLDRIQHNLGTWHDWWNTLDWITRKQKDYTGVVSLQSLVKQIEKKEQLLRLESLREIKGLLPRSSHMAHQKR